MLSDHFLVTTQAFALCILINTYYHIIKVHHHQCAVLIHLHTSYLKLKYPYELSSSNAQPHLRRNNIIWCDAKYVLSNNIQNEMLYFRLVIK
jgi:hypothetical protein